jgi:VanZ like family
VQGHSGRRAAFRFRVAGFVLLVGHLSLVFWLTLRPLTDPWVPPTAPEPLTSIRAELALGPWHAAQSLGGGLLLAPLGVLLPLAGGGVEVSKLVSLARTVFTGAMVSLIVELMHSGVTGQVINVDAVLLNTAGVAVAHLAVVPGVRAWLRRREDRKRSGPPPLEGGARPATPTMARVGVTRRSDASSGSRT